MFLPFSDQARSWEPKALEVRRLAGVLSNELLDPWKLAPKVGLLVVRADKALLQSLEEECRHHLLGAGGKRWSGGVLPIELPGGQRICILNPAHPRNRHKSTLMEEIAHGFLKHQPTKLIFDGDTVRARDFNDSQEKEAFGVGAAALLPWNTFFHHVNDGKTRAEIAAEYEVSEKLVQYRIQRCGAYALYQARQRVGSV